MFAPDRVTVTLLPSRGLAIVLGLAHGIGAAIPWWVALPVPLALAATTGVVALGALAVTRDALRMWPSSVTGLALDGAGAGAVTLRSGRTETVRLGSDGTVVPIAVVLSLRGTRRYGVVITRDACSEAEFRHLRVFLRWRLRSDPAGDGRGQ